MKIGFIGLGKLGYACAEVFASKYKVFGYDIHEVHSSSIEICGNYQSLCDSSDVIFIAVQTPHEKDYDGSKPSNHLEEKDFNYDYVKNVLQEINPYLDKSKILVLISTVLPGVTRNQLLPYLSNCSLIYNPYLIAMGTVKWDMVNPEMIIVGCENIEKDKENVDKLLDIYSAILMNNARIVVGTYEEAESIKIFYNTFISAKISLVNMIQDVSQKLGNINVDVVTKALAESTHRIMGPAYMKAGMGDGGPCHPRDNIALRHLAKDLNLGYDLFGAIMLSREKQAENLALFLCSFQKPITILGKSYKPGVNYTDGSYSLLVGSYIEKMGVPLKYDIIQSAFAQVYLLGHDIPYEDQTFPAKSIIVDPWRNFKSIREDLEIIWYGNTRKN